MPSPGQRPPLVYSRSCSSNVAQLANAIAVRLDRGGRAEMSCIAGAGVESLVREREHVDFGEAEVSEVYASVAAELEHFLLRGATGVRP